MNALDAEDIAKEYAAVEIKRLHHQIQVAQDAFKEAHSARLVAEMEASSAKLSLTLLQRKLDAAERELTRPLIPRRIASLWATSDREERLLIVLITVLWVSLLLYSPVLLMAVMAVAGIVALAYKRDTKK